jgi:hypothetical protein
LPTYYEIHVSPAAGDQELDADTITEALEKAGLVVSLVSELATPAPSRRLGLSQDPPTVEEIQRWADGPTERSSP